MRSSPGPMHRLTWLVLALFATVTMVACTDGRPSGDPNAVARSALEAYQLRHVDRLIALKLHREGPKVTPEQDVLFPRGKWRTETANVWDGTLGEPRGSADLPRFQYAQDDRYHYVVTLLRHDGTYYFRSLDRLLASEWAASAPLNLGSEAD